MSHHASSDSNLQNAFTYKGFTLIELLVVISIIALLISILLPALKKARGAVQAVACASNMRQVGIAFTTYTDDSGGLIPLAADHGSGIDRTFDDYLNTYLSGRLTQGEKDAGAVLKAKGNKTFQCPSDNVPLTSWATGGNYARRSYTMPWVVTGGKVLGTGIEHGSLPVSLSSDQQQAIGFRDIPSDSTTFLMIEYHQGVNIQGNYDKAGINGPDASSNQLCDANYMSWHDGSYNWLYCDGHVKRMTVEDGGWRGWIYGSPKGGWTRKSND